MFLVLNHTLSYGSRRFLCTFLYPLFRLLTYTSLNVDSPRLQTQFTPRTSIEIPHWTALLVGPSPRFSLPRHSRQARHCHDRFNNPNPTRLVRKCDSENRVLLPIARHVWLTVYVTAVTAMGGLVSKTGLGVSNMISLLPLAPKFVQLLGLGRSSIHRPLFLPE